VSGSHIHPPKLHGSQNPLNVAADGLNMATDCSRTVPRCQLSRHQQAQSCTSFRHHHPCSVPSGCVKTQYPLTPQACVRAVSISCAIDCFCGVDPDSLGTRPSHGSLVPRLRPRAIRRQSRKCWVGFGYGTSRWAEPRPGRGSAHLGYKRLYYSLQCQSRMGNRIGEPDRKEGSLQSNASGDVEQQFVQARLMAEAGLVRELTPGSSSRQPALSPSRSDAIKDMEVSYLAMPVISFRSQLSI